MMTDDNTTLVENQLSLPLRTRGTLKIKFSHTRYRALGPVLIPVYRQSARR